MTEESNEEIPQRVLPRISIAWMLGLMTVSSFIMVVFRFAYLGHAWARVSAMVFAMMVGIFACYAIVFLAGYLFQIVLRPSGRRSGMERGGGPPVSSLAKPPIESPIEPPGESTSESLVGGKSLLILACLLSLAPSIAAAKTPSDLIHGVYPIRKNRPTPYMISVGMHPAPGLGGYREFFFDFTPLATTFKGDHQLRIEVQIGDHIDPRVSPMSAKQVNLRQGDGVTTKSVLVPNMAAGNNVIVRVYEDGELLSKLPWVMPTRGQLRDNYANQNYTIGILDPKLVAGSRVAAPDVRTITAVAADGNLPDSDGIKRLSDKAARKLIGEVQPTWVQYRMLPMDTLSKEWLAYSDLDVLLATGPSWDQITKNRPDVRDAILKMVAAGGHLWIYGSSDDVDRRFPGTNTISPNQIVAPKQVKARIKLNRKNDNTPLVSNGWTEVNKASQNYGSEVTQTRKEAYDQLTRQSSPIVGTQPPAKVASMIRRDSFGLGSVLRIADDDPFPGSFQMWQSVFDLYDSGELIWSDRNGYDPRGGNTNYWRWLIPSVGGPPVKSFLTLNTFFAITVGPIAYLALRRKRRLFLLYFLAPLIAVAVTGGLFAYAVISDGWGTRGRIHQISFYDQANELLIQSDRETIYASFGSNDLRFPSDTMVTMISPVPAIGNYSYNNDGIPRNVGRITWTDQEQVFSDEFLPTRSQVQYSTLTPHLADPDSSSGAKAIAIRVDDSGDAPVLINESELTIQEFRYRDDQGKRYMAHTIEAGRRVPLKAHTLAQGIKTTGLTRPSGEPLLPPLGFVPKVQSNNWYSSHSPSADEPALEKMVRQFNGRQPKGTWIGVAGPDPKRYPASSLEISDSVHVIMGRSR